jgi:hypothetical protein
MEIRDVWKTFDEPARQRFLRKAGTTEGYVEKLNGGYCCPSLEMAAKLIAADRRLTYEGFLVSRRRRLAADREREKKRKPETV